MASKEQDILTNTLEVFEQAASPCTPLTTSEVADKVGVSRRTAYDRLERLVEYDDLNTKKVGARGRVWWRPHPTDVNGTTADRTTFEDTIGTIDVLDSADVGIVVLDTTLEIAWINETIERYFGINRTELIGQDKQRILDDKIAPTIAEPDEFAETVFATYKNNTYIEEFECHVTPGPNREERWLEHRSKPIESGRYAGGRIELYYDITERKRSKEALRKNQRQFRSFIDVTEEYAIFTLDADGAITTWNSGAERIYGYERAEVLGEHISRFYTKDAIAEGILERTLGIAATDGSIETEGWQVRNDGSRFWAQVTLTAVRDEDDLEGYAAIIRDMTDRREYERRLRQQRDDLEHELNEMFERIDDAFYAIDDQFRFTYVNERAEELLRHTEEELLGESVWDVFPEATETAVWECFHQALETQDHTSYEVYFESLECWVETNVYPSETGLSVYFRDVTERKEREQELDQFKTTLETIWDGVATLDADDRFVMVNEAFCEMTGYDRDELIGKHATLIHNERVNATAAELNEEVTRGKRDFATLEFALRTADGETIPVEGRFGPYEYEDGTFGRTGVVRDITERKERERKLEESERRYRTLAENFPNGAVALFDEDLRYTAAGGQLLDQLGISAEETVGNTIHKRYPEDIVAEIEPYFYAALDGKTNSFEIEYHGRDLRADTLSVRNADDTVFAGMLVVQDVTERNERERELERRARQQQGVAELGQLALETDDLDDLMHDACRLVSETLDNDYCKVLDLDTNEQELLLRQGVGWREGIVGHATVAANENSQAGYTLLSEEPVVVDDLTYETRFSGPELLTSHDVTSGISTIIGPVDEPWGILGTHDTAHQPFTEEDVDFIRGVANVLASAIERAQHERELASLNRLNRAIRDISLTAATATSREEIEKRVCEQVVETDPYVFAWIGDVERGQSMVTPDAATGVDEGYLEEIEISIDDVEARQGPTGQAIITGEPQFMHDILADPAYKPWREQARERGYRSSAALPLVHEGVLYGVLNVYAEEPHAFDGPEGEMLAQLGELVGHAIYAIEQRKALISDTAMELEFRISNASHPLLEATTDDEVTIAFERRIPADEGAYIQFVTVRGMTTEAFVKALEGRSSVRNIKHIAEGNDEHLFEVTTTSAPVDEALASRGGHIREVTIDDGVFRVVAECPSNTDVRAVINAIKDIYPETELLAQRTTAHNETSRQELHGAITDKLTDKQRSALEAAYFAGYFEWPRSSTGEEVATLLGLSPATFAQHIRIAQRKLFASVFDDRLVTE